MEAYQKSGTKGSVLFPDSNDSLPFFFALLPDFY